MFIHTLKFPVKGNYTATMFYRETSLCNVTLTVSDHRTHDWFN